MLALTACGSSKEAAPVKKDGGTAAAIPKDAAIDARSVDARTHPMPAKVFLHGAGRCGECHEKMYDEWEKSAHARSASSPLFKASAAAAAKDSDLTCEQCHTPLVADAPKDIVAGEGVTCDVCHTLRDAKPSVDGADFRLAIDDMVKFGPRCDLKDHYFHRMGCSPEHKEAVLCGGCHWWEPKGIPVFTEYKDWRDGPAAKAGEPCQSCHMPKTKAALAVGAPVRPGVPDHGLLGSAGDLRKTALALAVVAQDAGDKLGVRVVLTNEGAGHHVPAGLPGRRIVVTVTVTDETGKPIGTQTRSFGRVLVDAAGKPAPFWRAVKVGEDTRIPPNGDTTWDLAFDAGAGAGTVEVAVEHTATTEDLAKELGVTVDRFPLTGAKVPFPAKAGATRPGLPKIVRVEPPRAATAPRKKKGTR